MDYPSMRSFVKRLWGRVPEWVKPHVRGSRWFALGTRLAHPARKKHFDDEVVFFRRLFAEVGRDPRLIFDIGSNNGEKTEVYVSLGARVVAVEPTPDLANYLRQRFANNEAVSVVAAAASDTVGTTTLFLVDNSSAMNTINPKNADILRSGVNPRTEDRSKPEMRREIAVETTTLDALVEQFGVPDFIKIDVEGHEREVIKGLSKSVTLVSFEAALPEFMQETMDIVDLLAQANGAVRFQAREHGGFLLPGWVSREDIKTLIRQDRPYLEVFARNP